MKQFFSENLYYIVRCLINQIVMALFGVMVAFATLNNDPILLVGGILAAGLYLVLFYFMFWEVGGKDRIAEDAGRRTPTPQRAVLVSLIANVPNLIIAALLVISGFNGQANESWGNTYAVCTVLARGLQGMYLGIISFTEHRMALALGVENYVLPTFIFFLTTIPAVVSCWLGYFLGHRNFRIAGIFGIKPNTRDQTK
ncbi:MAG: hypothetical protein II719_00500 [Clostridia bacterium]|nr:hypothetical protein [Clostridia bacterium]